MRKIFHTFWHTLTTPEEWHTASAVAVGIAGSVLLTLLFRLY